ncbi:MAG: class I SAM-dependent methyltransferase [Nitrospirota bacterium]
MGNHEELEVYNLQAKKYLYPLGHKRIIKSLSSSGISSGRVLDIGSGTGLLCIEIARGFRDIEVFGVDISMDMLNIAKKAIIDEGLGSRVKFIRSDASSIPFKKNSFEAVVSYVSLHHWKDAAPVFNEVKRVLKKDGTALIYDLRRREENLIFAPLIRDNYMRNLFVSSLMASYTTEEAESILHKSDFAEWKIRTNAINLEIEAVAK